MFGGLEVLLLRDIPLLLFLGTAFGLLILPPYWMGQPSSKKRWTLRSLLLLFLSLIWIGGVVIGMYVLVMFVIPPFSLSPQTTYLMEPRSKEFYGIDYAAYIERQIDPGAPPEENGFRLLTDTFGRPFFDDIKNEHWNRLCEYLDLPTEIEPTLTFTDFWEYSQTLPLEKQEIVKTFYREQDSLLSDEAVPIVARWLDESDAALDLFIAAIQMPVLYIPPMFGTELINTLLYCDNTCRRMARELQIRIRYRLTVGEIDEAWDDVLAIYRLSEQHRRTGWNAISSLVNTSIVDRANRSAESVLLHSVWDSNEVRRKAEEIVPFLQPFHDDEIRKCLLNERLTALDSIHRFADGTGFDFLIEKEPPPETFEDFFKRRAIRFCRLGLTMIEINQYFDEMELWFFSNAPKPDDHWTFNTYEFLKLFAWYGRNGAIGVAIGRMLSGILSPAIDAWRTSLQTRRVNVSLTHLVFALETYRRDKGGYPDALDALREGYIAEVPLDPFSGEALRYVKEDEKYLLYSVGPNGIDDEGRNHSDEPKGDDIRRGELPQ